mgnify:CR=1 FL=1
MKILTNQEAADRLGYSKETLEQWRYRDRGLLQAGKPRAFGPAWVDVNGRCRGYLEEDVRAWLEERRTA